MRKTVQAMFQAKGLVITEKDILDLADKWKIIVRDLQPQKPLTKKQVKVPIVHK